MNNDFLSLGKSLKGAITKKITPVMLAGSLVFSSGLLTNANAFSLDEPQISYEEFLKYNGIKVFVNGRYVEFNSKTGYPVQLNGMTFVPVEAVAQAFNAHYAVEGKSAFVSKHGSELKIRTEPQHFQFIDDLSNPGDLLAIIWGREKVNFIPMDGKAFYKDGKVFISISTLFEMFGAKVVWNENKTIINVISDYDKNSEFIDFKNQKVIEMKDVDVNKSYSSIEFDGVKISSDYLKLLKNSNQYKVIVDNNNLYIYSYQYLMDANYLFKAHTERKYNFEDGETYYDLWSISPEEFEFVTNLFMVDGYYGFINGDTIDMDEVGNLYKLQSIGDMDKFAKVEQVADRIVALARSRSNDPKEMIRIVNKELCDLITYRETIDNSFYGWSNVYEAMVNRKDYCLGYAYSFKYIMDKLEIPCVIIGGSAGKNLPHAWNEVYVDNEWKCVDVSFNDISSNKEARLLVDPSDINYSVLQKERDKVDTVQRIMRLYS